jgi:Protein of unknown function (DUF2726).
MSETILIEGKDRTEEIHKHWDGPDGLIYIIFKGNTSKPYGYSKTKVKIMDDFIPTVRKCTATKLILHKNKPIYGLDKIKYLKNNIKVYVGESEWFSKTDDISIQKSTKTQNLTSNELVFAKGVTINAEIIYYFTEYVKIKYKNSDKISIYSKKDIIIVEKMNANFEKKLSYYSDIAKVKDKSMKETSDSKSEYLGKQMNNLFVRKDAMLYSFLTGKIENELQKDSNIGTIYPFGINLSQRAAIKNANKNRMSLIQGPPGTGKTQSILNILANAIVRNETVAVVSGNNEATKNVMEKMEESGYGFLIAMLGKTKNKEIFFANQPEYPIELNEWKRTSNQKEILLQEIATHEQNVVNLLAAENDIKKIEFALAEYVHEYEFFAEYLSKNDVEKLKRFSFFRMDEQKVLALISDIQNTNSKNVINKIKLFFKYGIKDFSQFLDIEPILNGMKDEYYQSKIKKLQSQKKSLIKTLKNNDFDQEMDSLIQKSKEYFEAFLAEKYSYVAERYKFQALEYWKDKEFEKFVNEYPVILSTAHAIVNSKNPSTLFDYVIVDEASQVELMTGVLALSVARNAVVVGDLQQLPHIPDSSVSIEQYDNWAKEYEISHSYDYYKQSLLSSIENIFGEQIPNTLLKEHYRCHSKIISFCNKKYYNNELICYTKSEVDKPLVLLRTVEGNHMRYGKNAVNKITNIRELDSLVDKEFLTELDLDFSMDKSFGFISPFRDQVNVSATYFPEKFQKDTVHKFQGRECDIVMFSSVLDKKAQRQYLLKFVDEPKLINVAVSRAKEKFILSSSVDTFKRNNGEISDLIKYMEYYEEDSVLYQSKVRSIFDLFYSDYATALEEKKKSKHWGTSKFVSENLMEEELRRIIAENNLEQKCKIANEVRLKELIRDTSDLTEEEKTYIENGARIDFVIYDCFNNQPLIAIEVDGYAFHENKPMQLEKDKLKDMIVNNDGLEIFRFATNHSGEKQILENIFNKITQSNNRERLNEN